MNLVPKIHNSRLSINNCKTQETKTISEIYVTFLLLILFIVVTLILVPFQHVQYYLTNDCCTESENFLRNSNTFQCDSIKYNIKYVIWQHETLKNIIYLFISFFHHPQLHCSQKRHFDCEFIVSLSHTPSCNFNEHFTWIPIWLVIKIWQYNRFTEKKSYRR